MIQTNSLTKIFSCGKRKVIALNEIDVQIKAGDFVLIKGESGCGKSTLLFTLGGMLSPSSGDIMVGGENIYEYTEGQRARYRANNIGFVFQSYHLLPYLSVMENIMISNKIGGVNVDASLVEEFAKQLHIDHRLHHKPSTLSVGEKQRVALARAMIGNPQLILADEPTGNLDPHNAQQVLNYLLDYNKKGGTVVMVTHGDQADKYSNSIVRMHNGKIMAES